MLTIPLIGVLLIAVASGLRNCPDCVDAGKCKDLVLRVRADKSEATAELLRKAHCGDMKFCCSEFSIGARMLEVPNQISDKDDIENHANVKLLPDQCGKFEGKRIIGGKVAAMNEYPWLALLSYRVGDDLEFNCGGALINKLYVLTAAHCTHSRNVESVRIGEYNISSEIDCFRFGIRKECQRSVQDIAISKKIVHPGYAHRPELVNDISLLRLEKAVDLTVANAGTVCLPILRSHRNMDLAGELGLVAGWGATENFTRSNVLLKVQVPIINTETCDSIYKRIGSISNESFNNYFCAGNEGHDSCSGDSGGPLMVVTPNENQKYKMTQFGIVSYGPITCGSNIPGVYTDVRKYMKWILDTLEP